jgi:hypothetical protein
VSDQPCFDCVCDCQLAGSECCPGPCPEENTVCCLPELCCGRNGEDPVCCEEDEECCGPEGERFCCPVGEKCCDDEYCCPDDHTCCDGECCPPDECCNDGVCGPCGCQSDEDCPEGECCVDGECVPPPAGCPEDLLACCTLVLTRTVSPLSDPYTEELERFLLDSCEGALFVTDIDIGQGGDPNIDFTVAKGCDGCPVPIVTIGYPQMSSYENGGCDDPAYLAEYPGGCTEYSVTLECQCPDEPECRLYTFEVPTDDYELSDFGPERIGTCEVVDSSVEQVAFNPPDDEDVWRYSRLVRITCQCRDSFEAAGGPVRGEGEDVQPISFEAVTCPEDDPP